MWCQCSTLSHIITFSYSISKVFCTKSSRCVSFTDQEKALLLITGKTSLKELFCCECHRSYLQTRNLIVDGHGLHEGVYNKPVHDSIVWWCWFSEKAYPYHTREEYCKWIHTDACLEHFGVRVPDGETIILYPFDTGESTLFERKISFLAYMNREFTWSHPILTGRIPASEYTLYLTICAYCDVKKERLIRLQVVEERSERNNERLDKKASHPGMLSLPLTYVEHLESNFRKLFPKRQVISLVRKMVSGIRVELTSEGL